MFYGRENANYIHANRYPVAAAQNLPQHLFGANRGPRPSADPWMARLCLGPTADPGHPRMTHLMQNSLLCIVKTTSWI